MVKVDKRDLEELLERLESGGAEEAIEAAMGQLAQYGMRVAKNNTPKQTGELRRNWTIAELNAQRVVLRNPTEYAEYVEYGHRQEPGRYVPKLGKRLKRSWVRGLFYATRSEETLRKNADKVIRPVLVKELEKMLNG